MFQKQRNIPVRMYQEYINSEKTRQGVCASMGAAKTRLLKIDKNVTKREHCVQLNAVASQRISQHFIQDTLQSMKYESRRSTRKQLFTPNQDQKTSTLDITTGC